MEVLPGAPQSMSMGLHRFDLDLSRHMGERPSGAYLVICSSANLHSVRDSGLGLRGQFDL